MALTEKSRFELHQNLEEVLGSEGAATLMELLPPVGWADVATKRDLDHLESRLTARIDRVEMQLDAKIDGVEHRLETKIVELDSKIDGVEHRLETKIVELRVDVEHGLRHQLVTTIGSMTAITAALLTIFRFV